jgi:rfaE bifunctional protein nucleotidyltransferase chain/domain
MGDYLIVGLNSDKSIRKIKGTTRPIIPQEQRAEILLTLSIVNEVIIFDEESPLNLIQKIKPDVLVKGMDWKKKDIIGADFMQAINGKVVRIPLISSVSTSEIIKKIKGE